MPSNEKTNQAPATSPQKVDVAPAKGRKIRVENTREHPLVFVRQTMLPDGRVGPVEEARVPRGGVPRGADGADAFRNGVGEVGEELLTYLLAESATVRAWHRNGWMIIDDDAFQVPKYIGPEIKRPRLPEGMEYRPA